MTIVTLNEICIDPYRGKPGCFLVSMPDEDSKYGEYVSAHFNYESALSEALYLQQEYAPAVIRDRAGGAP